MDESDFDQGTVYKWDLSTVDTSFILVPVHMLICICDNL